MYKGLVSAFFLISLLITPAFANQAPGTADKKEKPAEVSVSCNDAKDDNGESYCDKDLTQNGNCGNALADKDITNEINKSVCCMGKAGDLTYMYSGTPYDPCSMISVTGTSGANKKIVVKVNKDKDCNNQLCKEFPPTVMEGLDIAIGPITCAE